MDNKKEIDHEGLVQNQFQNNLKKLTKINKILCVGLIVAIIFSVYISVKRYIILNDLQNQLVILKELLSSF